MLWILGEGGGCGGVFRDVFFGWVDLHHIVACDGARHFGCCSDCFGIKRHPEALREHQLFSGLCFCYTNAFHMDILG